MNSQELFTVCILSTAILNFLTIFYINNSVFNKKIKYIIIIVIFFISLVFLYALSLSLFNNSSELAINTSEIDPNLSSIISIFTPSGIHLDDLDSLRMENTTEGRCQRNISLG